MKNYRIHLTLALAAVAISSMAAKPLRLKKNNVQKIVQSMTLEEKARMVVGCSSSAFVGYGNSTLYVPGSAASTAMNERLGIVPTVLADGPAGLRISPKREGAEQTFYCTAFPIGTALASSWSIELVEQVGAAIGEEAREYGVDVLLAPGLNLQRDPLCGRNFEYYSEDPLLSGKVAAAYIRGVQSQGVGTSAKHYAVNNAESNRKDNDSRLDERTLRELYLKGFEIAVKEAQPWTVMTSYNAVNGVQAMESRELLTDILRNEWSFDGYVMCDWAYAGLRNTARELYAGNDLLTPGSEQQYQEVLDAVNNGTLQMVDLDACVEHILNVVVRTPRFNGYKYSDRPDLAKNAQVARQAAAESIVLLQNHENTLPLNGNNSSLGLFGISSYDFTSGGTGSGSVNMAYVVNLKQALIQVGYRVNGELDQYYTDKVRLALENLSDGFNLGRTSLKEVSIDPKMIEQSAEKDELAIVTIGRSNGEGLDRHAFDDFFWTREENMLLENVSKAFHARGKRVVVVLNVSGAIEVERLKQLADAVVCCWLPGQEGGNAVVDVMTGRENPSGKLTMTIPVSYFDTNTYDNFPYDYTGPVAMGKYALTPRPERKNVHYINYEEGIYVGYRYFHTQQKAVSYPFGYGLSYTTFAYTDAQVTATLDGGFEAQITITNNGKTAGKEAVQLYVSAPAGGLDKPACELRSFGKTRLLQPGESQTLTFRVDAYTLASYNPTSHHWETAAGDYQLHFAANVEDVRESVKVSLPGNIF